MHRFGPEMKRTQPIMFFGPNSDVLVHSGRFRYCDRNHAGVAFNAPIRVRNETMLRFGPEMKQMHPIMFFGHNSDVLVRFGPYVIVLETMVGLHSMERLGQKTKRCTDSGQK